MKQILLMGYMMVAVCTSAQMKVDKNIPVKSGQKVVFILDNPMVKLHSWDKQEIFITGTASINRGENDSAFELQVESNPSGFTVTSVIKDKENLPQRMIIKKGDREYYFKTGDYNNPEVQKFMDENGRDYSYMSTGIIMDIKLEIFVPRNIETAMVAKYGLVEVTEFNGPLTIDAKYGGVDATLVAQSTGQLTAKTQFGEILTNLDIKFDRLTSPGRNEKRWTEISASLGSGPRYSFESKYGNVYLRKPK